MPTTTNQTLEAAAKSAPYAPVYKSLRVTPLNAEWNKKTCNYWYTVTDSAFSHKAFNQRESLMRWLNERNLTIDESALAPHMQGGESLKVTGSYAEQAHMSYDEFYSLSNVVVETRTLSNGDYTMARITEDANGFRTVHTLNPNCKFRPVYDYTECRETLG